MGNKTCKGCCTEKPHSEFPKDRSRSDGHGRLCRECNKARCRDRYYANPEISRLRSRQWHSDNKDRRAEYDRKKYLENREAKRLQADSWKQANPERVAAHKKAWQRRDRDRYLDQKRANESKRRARRAMVPVIHFDKSALDARLAYYGYKCWMCKSGPYEELDHVKPLSKGGPHILSNLRPACKSCNQAKHANWPFLAS